MNETRDVRKMTDAEWRAYLSHHLFSTGGETYEQWKARQPRASTRTGPPDA